MAQSSKYRSTIQSPSRHTQRDRILSLLRSRQGEWVSLPEILDLHIGQYGARILELRRAGIEIENKIERDDSGAAHSWYRIPRKHEQFELSIFDEAVRP